MGNPLAIAFRQYIEANCQDFASFRECRILNGCEIVTFDLNTQRPQYPVYNIEAVETVSICFFPEDSSPPAVFVARSDFPDTPHQNLVPEGFPSQICIDDRPWQDVRAGYTAAELMARITAWFSKACQGELHDLDQPIDPVFINDHLHEIILTKAAADAIVANSEDLVVTRFDEELRYLAVVPASKADPKRTRPNLVIGHCSVEPEAMRRMRRSPRNLAELADFLESRGVRFLPLVGSILEAWMTKSGGHVDPGKSLFCLLVNMPIVHPLTQEVVGENTVAFVANVSAGQVGEALGYLYENPTDTAESFSYSRVVPVANPTLDRASEIAVNMALIHRAFDQTLAVQLSGGQRIDEKRAVLVGAGALGSSLAESLVREGLFKWTLLDDDDLLPHNLSRHTLTSADICKPKAERLARRLSLIREDADVKVSTENVLQPKSKEAVEAHFQEADIIIDASASVSVARALSDRPGNARRISAFFTPAGNAAVLMIESENRAEALRDIEANYLREVLSNPALESHMGRPEDMPYTGACRAVTSRISSTSVHLLSGLIAHGIARHIDETTATLKVWQVNPDGSVACISGCTDTVACELQGWTVHYPGSLRQFLLSERERRLPNETGGVLLGIIDQDLRRIDVVHVLCQPEDSVASPSGFTRGTRKLRKAVERAVQRSGNQVRYIGEWHSHPKGCAATPSSTDMQQIKELSLILNIDGVPAVTMIIGEEQVGVLLGRVING